MAPTSTSWLGLVYNQNPFYLISAALLLCSLQSPAVNVADPHANPWFLSGVLSGYTLLLTATAILIVRFGKVWDDARSLMLVILLMLFAVSTSFDRLCLENPWVAVLILSLGALFSFVVVETLLRSTKIRLGWKFRFPLHSILCLSFLFPLVFSTAKVYQLGWDHRIILICFPFVAGLLTLGLIPAARRGKSYVAQNGTPWAWPLFPYSVFILLLVGLCGRTYLLTEAFDTTMGSKTIFGGYLLAPIGLSTLIVFYEVCLKEKFEFLQPVVAFAILLPACFCILSKPNFAQIDLFQELNRFQLNPTWLIVVATAIFYFQNFLRTQTGEVYLTVALLVLSLLGGHGHFVTFENIAIYPFLGLAAIQLIFAERRRVSIRWLASFLLLMPISVLLVDDTSERILVGLNHAFFSCVICGLLFNDIIAKQFRSVLTIAMPFWFLSHWLAAFWAQQSIYLVSGLGLTLLAFGCGMLVVDRRKIILVSVLGIAFLIAILTPACLETFDDLQLFDFGILPWTSMCCFALGATVSLSKAGGFSRLTPHLQVLKNEFWEPFGNSPPTSSTQSKSVLAMSHETQGPSDT